MQRLRILHLCGWYPHAWGPRDSPFIKRHIDALSPHAENTVWHIEVRPGPLRFSSRSLHAHRTCMARIPTQRWLLVEWMTTALVWWMLSLHFRRGRFDLVNLHIAYPLGLHTQALLKRLGLPLVITEHWSAYHYSFNSTSPGLERIRRIFRHGLPLITVSRSLEQDIERFSGTPQRWVHHVDNVADTAVFRPAAGTAVVEGRFLAIAGWRPPKRPDVLLDAVKLLQAAGRHATLRIAGDGPLLQALLGRIEVEGLSEHVELLGHCTPERLAEELRSAHALLHPSDHETYSVVCVEALSTGTPVIASAVGGIPEYLTAERGALVPHNDPKEWAATVDKEWERLLGMDRQALSRSLADRVSPEAVGARYFAALMDVWERWPDAAHLGSPDTSLQ